VIYHLLIYRSRSGFSEIGVMIIYVDQFRMKPRLALSVKNKSKREKKERILETS